MTKNSDSLDGRVARIRSLIEAAATRSGRPARAVTIVAVTKTHPLEATRKACALGLRNIGENRVQEAQRKYEDGGLRNDFPDAYFHLIGHLQSNKARKSVQLFDSIDSVDSIDLARILSQISGEFHKKLRILLEVNVTGEAAKSGFDPKTLVDHVPQILSLPDLSVAGLMTVGPLTTDSNSIRNSFRTLRNLFDEIKQIFSPPDWNTVSMGMSEDFEIAIEEGATEIRLGSALFGSRRQ